MLCETCQTRIPFGIDYHASTRGVRPREQDNKQDEADEPVDPYHPGHGNFRIHDRLDAVSFYESIKLGCFVCRHLWYCLLDRRQALQLSLEDRENVSESRRERVVCHTFEDFSKEVADIMTHLATKRGLCPTDLLAPGIGFRVTRGSDPMRSIVMKGPMVPGDCSRWHQSFYLCEVREENANDAQVCFPKPDHRALSNSTSLMPQLWNYWFRTCKAKHALCRSLDANHDFQPKRLVRIIPPLENAELKWCLAFPGATEPVEYVTLSHCWGSHQPYTLTDGNIGALQLESRADVLPKTYQDAFDVALSLGCRHIWIDSLCIIQGNQQDWLEQSPQMASIYGGARCNIAATWASDGTHGCFTTRDPFTVLGTTISLRGRSEQYHVTRGHLYERDFYDHGPLNKRGWVVQERCLSTRQLSFTRKQVYWECAELFASEQFPNGWPETVWKENRAFMLLSPTTPKPRLNHRSEVDNRQSWCSLVETFSKCAFAHASDKMMALASLAGSRRQQTGDTYLAGLWKRDLHRQLL